MESAIRTICEPIFDKPLMQISFGTVLLRLFEALRRFNGQIQPQLILLQKTLLNVEGLGRQLYPELDIWKTASPILREWMREKHHPLNVARRMWKKMPELLQALEAAPDAVRQHMVAAAQPKASQAAFASDAHRRNTQHRTQTGGARHIAPALVLLAGVLALGVERIPAWAGWLLGFVGAAWLIAGVVRPSGKTR